MARRSAAQLGRRIAEYLSLLILGPLLLVVFLGLAHAAIDSAAMQDIATLPLVERLVASALTLAPYAMVTTIFTGLCMFMPNTSVRIGPALDRRARGRYPLGSHRPSCSPRWSSTRRA